MKRICYIVLFMLLCSCQRQNNDKDINDIKNTITSYEMAGLPLTIQQFADDIKIDSLVIINQCEPYIAYFVTKWKPKHALKYQTVYVKVENIRVKRDYVTWHTDWFSAWCSTY